MITVRLATSDDGPIIREIIFQSVLEAYGRFMPDSFMQQFVDSDRAGQLAREGLNDFFLADLDGETVGVMLLENGYIDQLWILPDKARQGVGSALLTYAERISTQEGLSKLTLNCFEKNTRAQAFYRAKGYVVEKSYTSMEVAPGETTCLLAKDLASATKRTPSQE